MKILPNTRIIYGKLQSYWKYIKCKNGIWECQYPNGKHSSYWIDEHFNELINNNILFKRVTKEEYESNI